MMDKTHPASWEVPLLVNLRASDFSHKHHPGSILLVEKDQKRALELKNKGNTFFSSKAYVEAYDEYSEAIEYCPEEPRRDRAILYANRAACLLELGRNEEAIKDCTTAIDIDGTYLKAYLRRAKANENLDQLEDTLADLTSALKIEPKNMTLKSDCDKMQKRVTEKQEKLKEEMLGKLKEMGNTILGKFGLSLDNFKMQQDPATGSYSVNFQQ